MQEILRKALQRGRTNPQRGPTRHGERWPDSPLPLLLPLFTPLNSGVLKITQHAQQALITPRDASTSHTELNSSQPALCTVIVQDKSPTHLSTHVRQKTTFHPRNMSNLHPPKAVEVLARHQPQNGCTRSPSASAFPLPFLHGGYGFARSKPMPSFSRQKGESQTQQNSILYFTQQNTPPPSEMRSPSVAYETTQNRCPPAMHTTPMRAYPPRTKRKHVASPTAI